MRPSNAEQKKHIQKFADRYNQKIVESLGGDYWKYNIFVFTSYPGGSGNFDIGHLSGLWSLKNVIHISKCENDVTNLNSKKIAGIWVLSHTVTNIKWVDNRYVMVVKPTERGVQFLQFYRQENQDKLPLTVVTENGNQVAVLAN
ncbi:hypothetical protein HW132_10775 [Brasilonema sp. CT11]|nr:hypothetical protein [Brasilonema sp. CT11]